MLGKHPTAGSKEKSCVGETTRKGLLCLSVLQLLVSHFPLQSSRSTFSIAHHDLSLLNPSLSFYSFSVPTWLEKLFLISSFASQNLEFDEFTLLFE